MGSERGGAPAGEREPGVCHQWRDGLWQDHTGKEGARFIRRRHLTAPPFQFDTKTWEEGARFIIIRDIYMYMYMAVLLYMYMSVLLYM